MFTKRGLRNFFKKSIVITEIQLRTLAQSRSWPPEVEVKIASASAPQGSRIHSSLSFPVVPLGDIIFLLNQRSKKVIKYMLLSGNGSP